jgi:hypothetical protein
MVYFRTKNPDLGKYFRAFDWKILKYILWPFGIFYRHLGSLPNDLWLNFVFLWCILSGFGTYRAPKKSGTPVFERREALSVDGFGCE